MEINWSILKSMRSLSLSYRILIAVFFITRFSLAQESTSIPEHRLMPRFPDSEVTALEFVEDTNYRLILSSLQRARGLVSSENSEMLRGDITKIIYEIAPEFTGQDVFEYFNNEAEEKITGNYFRVSVESVVAAIIGQTIFLATGYSMARNETNIIQSLMPLTKEEKIL